MFAMSAERLYDATPHVILAVIKDTPSRESISTAARMARAASSGLSATASPQARNPAPTFPSVAMHGS